MSASLRSTSQSVKQNVATAGLWHDLRDACPVDVSSLKAVLHALVGLVACGIVYINLPAMRVENGSQDSCDPVRTYGEITTRGMSMLVQHIGGVGGSFLDIGSGEGSFPIWACSEGGFDNCIGVELEQARHMRAVEKLAAASASNVKFLHGDIQQHPRVFHGLRVAFWNNLCFPAEVGQTVVEHFSRTAPAGAEMFTLAEIRQLPHGVTQSRVYIPLEMNWGSERGGPLYMPFKLTRV